MTKNRESQEISGFVNIDKPETWTSHDVVQKLRRILGIKRIGHTGTLDPFATGVLPIAIGSSTRLIRFLPKSKKYLAEINFSFTTDTDDLTGMVLKPNCTAITEGALRSQLQSMIGSQDQYPPLYSAKKINGKKLYELMREGQALDLSDIKAKNITIYDNKLLSFSYPFATIEVTCSEGTYIRSIARDLGGHLSKLRRLESNGFDLRSSIRFEDLEEGDLELTDLILKSKDCLSLPELSFDHKDVISLQQGRQIYISNSTLESTDRLGSGYIKCLDPNNELIGLANITSQSKQDIRLAPEVIL
jgi:tRNA pseudouridine55 synthase